MVTLRLIPLLALAAAAACDFPADADGTLNRVHSEHVLRVGVSPRPPWVSLDQGKIAGIEADLVRKWASSLGAEVDWIGGSESALIRALNRRKIDVVIAGIRDSSPWTDHAAATQRCIRTRIVVALPRGEHLRGDLAGRTVAYPSDRPDFAAAIAAEGAVAEPRADVRGRMAAVYEFEAAKLALEPTDVVLAREALIMLVPRGESAFLYALDTFLAKACRAALAGGAPQ